MKKKHTYFLVTIALFWFSAFVSATTYYIDSTNGLTTNNGKSPESAWKTLSNINTQTFNPGDSILFKSGCEWTGRLRPQGSGLPNLPICIDKYGSGALPKINQGTLAGVVLLLQDQEQWEIRNLEIDGGTTTDKSTQQVGGIQVLTSTAGKVLNHIVIADCVIRNMLGSVKLYESCAIWVGVPGWNLSYGLTTSFNDVLIENNKIYTSDRCGILVWTTAAPGAASQFQAGLIPSKNVIIRNNLLEDIGGDAILVLGSDKPLIERNVVRRCCTKAGNPIYGTDYNQCAAAIWLHHCEKGIMQYNAVYDCLKLGTNNDGMAYDFDFNCNGNILQYNYSRNNAGGFLLIMGTATNNIARYNISENDREHVLFCVGDKSDKNLVYNNTFYINAASSYIIPRAIFSNNIFMADGSATMSITNSTEGVFSNNCYAGNWGTLPTDAGKITATPMFVNGGQGGANAENLAAYKMSASSPCIGKGVAIANNGGVDILGSGVSQTSLPDIGAIQQNNLVLNFENKNTAGMSIGDGTTTDAEAYQIVQNPETFGLNKSNYCLKIIHKPTFTAWGSGDSYGINIPINPTIAIDKTGANHYLHFKYMSNALGIIAGVELKSPKSSFTSQPAKNINTWIDVVFDLNNTQFDITSLDGIYVVPDAKYQTNGRTNDVVVYFDDIEINNIATVTTVPLLNLDFENGLPAGISAALGDVTDTGAYAITPNPVSTGLNTSATCLKVVHEFGFSPWGSGDNFGIDIPFANPIPVDKLSANHYLHFKYMADTSGLLVGVELRTPKYFLTAPLVTQTGKWVEVVIDLNTVSNFNISALDGLYLVPDNKYQTNGRTTTVVVYFDDIKITDSPSLTGTHVVNQNTKYSLYPNPTSDKFTIENAQDSELILVNSLGQVVLKSNITSNKYSFNVAAFNKELYILNIIAKDKSVSSQKIIIK